MIIGADRQANDCPPVNQKINQLWHFTVYFFTFSLSFWEGPNHDSWQLRN